MHYIVLNSMCMSRDSKERERANTWKEKLDKQSIRTSIRRRDRTERLARKCVEQNSAQYALGEILVQIIQRTRTPFRLPPSHSIRVASIGCSLSLALFQPCSRAANWSAINEIPKRRYWLGQWFLLPVIRLPMIPPVTAKHDVKRC